LEARQPAFRERGFPEPDPITRLYCIEAVDRWRMRRRPCLFPKFTSAPTAALAGAVFDERLDPFDCHPVVDASRANGRATDRVLPCDVMAPSVGRDLRVNTKAKADGSSKLYCCRGRPDVQIVTANALLVVRTSLPLEIASKAPG
jgi:hypothetical protein